MFKTTGRDPADNCFRKAMSPGRWPSGQLKNVKKSPKMDMVLMSLLCAGCLLLAFAGYKAFKVQVYLQSSEVVPGRVTDHVARGGEGYRKTQDSDLSAPSMHPLIEYTLKSGETRTFVSSLTSSSLPDGDLRVRYSMLDPERVEVDSFFMNWMWAIIPAVIGGFMAFASLVMLSNSTVSWIASLLMVLCVGGTLFYLFRDKSVPSASQMDVYALDNLNFAYSTLYHKDAQAQEILKDGVDGYTVTAWALDSQTLNAEQSRAIIELLDVGRITFSEDRGVFCLVGN